MTIYTAAREKFYSSGGLGSYGSSNSGIDGHEDEEPFYDGSGAVIDRVNPEYIKAPVSCGNIFGTY